MAAHKDNIGMETFVFTVMVDKPGTQLLTLVSVHQDQSGTDMLVSTHAAEEESLMPQADNVFAQLVTGMELHALFAQILKSGHHQD